MRRDRLYLRRDQLYLVVTVGIKKNTYRLTVRRPRLKANEYAYSMTVRVNEEDWLGRLKEVSLPTINPPEITNPELTSFKIGKTLPEEVADEMAARDGEKWQPIP